MLDILTLLNCISDADLRSKYVKLYMENKHLFTEYPASTKYHHSWKCGLDEHTKEVMNLCVQFFMVFNADMQSKGITADDAIICGFIHDLDKLGKYAPNSVPPESAKQEFVYNNNRLDASSVGRTVNILSKYGITLTDAQLNALTFTEGGWSVESKARSNSKPEPLAVLVHMADLYSTYFWGYKK